MKKLLSIILACAVIPVFAKVESHWDGGRNTPVHRLTLNDEFGDVIVPNAPNALPLSTRQTCGQCHDYDTIASGWHFNMSARTRRMAVAVSRGFWSIRSAGRRFR